MARDSQESRDIVFGSVPDIPGAGGKAVEPDILDGEDLEVSDKLQALQEWRELSPLQRKVLAVHIRRPELNKKELAEEVGCSTPVVTRLFHSQAFAVISDELVKVCKKELQMEAIKVMRGLLRSKNDMVRRMAARDLLADAGLLRDAEKTTNHNKKITLSWQGEKPKDAP